ncbi:MAG: zinc-ribbon domain-containing protein [Clostridia bacterium]|nr:zinc-ribbon domain-containing protein [Clostridia bacterium]
MAFCTNCGAQVPDGSAICPNCGTQLAPAAAPQPTYQAPVYQAPAYQPAPALDNGPIFTFGLLSVILCWFGIPGLIFAIIAKKKIKNYLAAGGQLTGRAKAGSIMATIGLIVSIVMMVVWPIYFISIAAFIEYLSSSASYNYY